MFFFIFNIALSSLAGYMATAFGAPVGLAIGIGIVLFVLIYMIRFGAGGGIDDAFDVLSD